MVNRAVGGTYASATVTRPRTTVMPECLRRTEPASGRARTEANREPPTKCDNARHVTSILSSAPTNMSSAVLRQASVAVRPSVFLVVNILPDINPSG